MHDYDYLSSDEQAVVRAAWSDGMDRRISDLDLATEFELAETSYSELDAVGQMVTRDPSRSS